MKLLTAHPVRAGLTLVSMAIALVVTLAITAVLTNSDFGRFERFLGRRGTYISAQLAALDSLSEALATFRALDAPPVPEPSLAEAVEAWFALRRDNSELSAAAEDAMRARQLTGHLDKWMEELSRDDAAGGEL